MNPEKIVIGVDEAGYGPNLGPLVIGVTVWKIHKTVSEADVCERFAKFCSPTPWEAGCTHVPLGDSKKLYQPASGITSLETGLLAILSASDDQVQHLGDFMGRYARIKPAAPHASAPWYDALHRFTMPRDAEPAEITRLGEVARQSFEAEGIAFLAAKALVISETAFNQSVAVLGSKGQVLSSQTLGLVAEVLADWELDAEIYCDRHGGRKNYLPVLLDAMPEEWFDETRTGNQRCSYRNRGDRSLEFHFSVQGDQFPPTAMASMLAKCLREYLMQSFNNFWQLHIPGLKSTAGYPVDAQRFRAEIRAVAAQLGLAEETWWRCR